MRRCPRWGRFAKEIRGAVGRTLVDHDNEMGLPALFENITDETPFYGEVKPAVTAVLWGLCRAGEFRPVAEDGEALSADELLDALSTDGDQAAYGTVVDVAQGTIH